MAIAIGSVADDLRSIRSFGIRAASREVLGTATTEFAIPSAVRSTGDVRGCDREV